MRNANQDFYDPYFYWARRGNRKSWLYQFKNLHIEDVTCKYCTYKPKSSTQHPKQCFRAHVKKQHPREFALDFNPSTYVISEQPDFALV